MRSRTQPGLPSDWVVKPLGEVCEVNPSTKGVANLPDSLDVSFVPMAAVSEDGRLLESMTKQAREVKKGFRHFKEKDVLLAKITPSFENGKRWLAADLTNGIGFGSTEFHVLRAHNEVLPEWLFYFVGLARFRAAGHERMSGTAGQKRVPTSFLKRTTIPVPPTRVQARLIRAIVRAERLRELRRQANLVTPALIQSIFLKMFGDPASNPEGWPETTLGEILVSGPANGLFKRKLAYGSGVPIVWVESLFDRYLLDHDGLRRIDASAEEVKRFGIQPGDILLCRSSLPVEGVGKMVAVGDLNGPTLFESHVMRLRVDPARAIAHFVVGFYNSESGRKLVLEKARISTMTTINQPDVKSLRIFLPPLEVQQRFKEALLKLDATSQAQQESTRQISELFESVLDRAFRGELASFA